MNYLQVKGTLVHMCRKLELMVPSKRELDHAKPGMIHLPVVNSNLMDHLHIKEATHMEVSINICFTILVIACLQSQGSLSLSNSSSFVCPLGLPYAFSTPSFPIPRERGKPKKGLAYYSFVSHHFCLGPPVKPILPLASQDHLAAPPL
jgi:hypothetical protein